ncbi:hypothetical protein BDZ97DRAFT_1763272 [Flammula alnicola]|nr:hypothetical protein BDZ97DRAFT_1763272 [Flammula alnicola]
MLQPLSRLIKQPRRRMPVWTLLSLSALATITLFYGARSWSTDSAAFPFHHSTSTVDVDYPPSYQDIRDAEENLPQLSLDLPYPEGRNGRYVKFSCQIQQLGWNNVLNELGNTIPGQNPRPSIGPKDSALRSYLWPNRWRTMGPDDPAPRSITEKWFEVVCPPEKRRIINTRELKPALTNAPGSEIFAAWQKILLDAPESCIEIQSADTSEDAYSQVFDLWLWGTTRVLSLWDEFSKSPVSRLLGTSHIVERALEYNKRIFHAARKEEVDIVDPYSRMLAIHLRRGDFKQACLSLSNWNSTFYSWNLHEFLPDKFTPPPGGSWGTNTPRTRHYPRFEGRLFEDSGDERREEGRIDVLYMLTNDESEWLDEVKQSMKADGWRVIATSRDLRLDREGKDVGMAVDMEIARKASIFIGNGWSSFTSNILHRRLVDGKIPMSNRFY